MSEMRPLTVRLSALHQADGSALLLQGQSTALVSVFGPRDVRVNKEKIDKATIEVLYKAKTGLPGCYERSLQAILQQTCEAVILANLHPRTLISITVQELQNSGSFLACCLNAMCAALLDAAIPMKNVFAAVCIVKITQDGISKFILDPSLEVEEHSEAQFVFCIENRTDNIITCYSTGEFSIDELEQASLLCLEASKEIFSFFRSTMQSTFSKELPLASNGTNG